MIADVVGISSMATRQILAELGEAYRVKTGQSITIESVGGIDAARRIRANEKFDIVVLADEAMKTLEADGFLKPQTRTAFAESPIAIAVRAGAKRPDLANEAAARAFALSAKSLGYSTGPSGTHVLKLLERWGIDRSKAGQAIQAPPGVPVGSLIAQGKVEFGFQQLSELLDVPGIEIAGVLPPEIQSLTLFACGVGAQAANEAGARDLIQYLTSPEADATKRRLGMAPPGTA